MSKPRGIMEDHTDYVRHQVERLTPSSAGVEFHLKLTQDVVARMARNSALTKTWCATLVAAIMVLVARTEVPMYLWVAVVPIVLLCFVDTRYLAQERAFRRSYNEFVKQLHRQELDQTALFIIGSRVSAKENWSALGSWSVLPFYTGMTVAVVGMFVMMSLCLTGW